MVGWVRADKPHCKVVFERLEVLARGLGQVLERCQHAALAGEMPRVLQRGQHILVAREQPAAESLAEGHR